MASMWAMVSVTETGHRGLLLISPCDLRQDTDSSGGSDSRARAVPGTRENDCKSLPASRPSAEANQGPLRLSPQLPQGKDCGLASLQYSQCQLLHHVSTPRFTKLPCFKRPQPLGFLNSPSSLCIVSLTTKRNPNSWSKEGRGLCLHKDPVSPPGGGYS